MLVIVVVVVIVIAAAKKTVEGLVTTVFPFSLSLSISSAFHTIIKIATVNCHAPTPTQSACYLFIGGECFPALPTRKISRCAALSLID